LRHGIFSDIFEYHERKLLFYESTRSSFIKEIKKELRTHQRNLKIDHTIHDDVRRQQEVEFIYCSLHLEGNPLTLPETQELIFDEIYPKKQKMIHINEVSNYKRAVDRMIYYAELKTDLTLQMILEYHGMAMAHIHGAGELRQQNVRIKGNPNFKTTDWRSIPEQIMDLMEKYEKFRSSNREVEEVIHFSALFHNEFQRIHPFIDGNSRISRLLMMFILRFHNIPVLDLPLGYYDTYMDLTKRSLKRNDDAFASIVEEMVFFSLKRMNS
jgi:Fic family protein